MHPGLIGSCHAAQPSPSGRYIAAPVDGRLGLYILQMNQAPRALDFKIRLFIVMGQEHPPVVCRENPNVRPHNWEQLEEAGMDHGEQCC